MQIADADREQCRVDSAESCGSAAAGRDSNSNFRSVAGNCRTAASRRHLEHTSFLFYVLSRGVLSCLNLSSVGQAAAPSTFLPVLVNAVDNIVLPVVPTVH